MCGARTSAAKLAALFLICVCLAGCAAKEYAVERAAGYRAVKNWPQLPEKLVFDRCLGIATDSAGKVYMTGNTKEKGNDVFVFAPDGKYLGSWKNDKITQGHGLRIRNDRVWITDIGNHQVYELTLDGKLLRELGQRGKAGETETQFNCPTDIAFAPNGDLYISDGYGNSRVVCLSPEGKFKFAWGTKGDKPGQFYMPHNIVVDWRGRVYVADRGNQRVQVFDAKGGFIAEWISPARAFGLALGPDRTVVVADGDGHRVMLFSPDGRLLAKFGEAGNEPGKFKVPHSIHVDENGDVFVAEVADAAGGATRIHKFTRK